jgi:hypothetical protein
VAAGNRLEIARVGGWARGSFGEGVRDGYFTVF